MNTRIFSVLAAVAMSSAAAIPALAHDTSHAAAQPTASSPSMTPAGTTQSAQAMTPSTRGNAVAPYGSPAAPQRANDDNTVHGVGGNVKVGNGPGYAWWKDR